MNIKNIVRCFLDELGQQLLVLMIGTVFILVRIVTLKEKRKFLYKIL